MGVEDQLKQGRPGSIHHMSGCEVDVGGRGRYSNTYRLNLKASFLAIKKSGVNHAKVWSSKLQLCSFVTEEDCRITVETLLIKIQSINSQCVYTPH